jgi:hypothetical protein
VGDADIALILAEKEQARVTARLAPTLEEADEVVAGSIARLCGDIGSFLGSGASSSSGGAAALSHTLLGRLANLQARNEVLRSLNDTVHQMIGTRSNLPPGAVASLADALSQGLGAVLMSVDDATHSGTREEISLLKQIQRRSQRRGRRAAPAPDSGGEPRIGP